MRSYIIDELDAETLRHLEERLAGEGFASRIEKLYWVPLDTCHLSPLQLEHQESCGPHCLALEILDTGVRLELLVRAKGRMRCECVHYLSPEDRNAMQDWLDTFVLCIQEDEIGQLFGTCC